MKSVIILSAIALTLVLNACNNSSEKTEQNKSNTSQASTLDTTKLKKGDVFYKCEMCADVISDKSGECSKCGMQLMKMEKK